MKWADPRYKELKENILHNIIFNISELESKKITLQKARIAIDNLFEHLLEGIEIESEIEHVVKKWTPAEIEKQGNLE